MIAVRQPSAEIVADIEHRAAAGESLQQIACATGAAGRQVRVIVRQWRDRTNTPWRPSQARGLPPETLVRMASLLKEGRTKTEIAKVLGVTVACVSKRARLWAAPADRKPKRRRLDADEAVIVVERLWHGETQSDIARSLGISVAAVSARDKRYRALHGSDSLPPPIRALSLAPEVWAEREQKLQEARKVRIARRLQRSKERAAQQSARAAARSRAAEDRAAARDREANQRRRDAMMISSQAQSARRDALYAQIAAQVPRWITGATRDDIISDVYLQAMESAR